MSDTFIPIDGHRALAPGAQADNGASPEPPPLVEFDTAGRAAVISYSLPESMSYSGRRLVDLGFKGADFVELASPGLGASVARRSDVAALRASASVASTPPEAVVAPRSVVLTPYRGAADAGTRVVDEALAPFPCSAHLASLTWGAVETIAAAGKRAEIYRSIGGALDYRVRPAAIAPGTGSSAGLTRRDDDGGGSGGSTDPLEPPEVTVGISSPGPSSGPLTGPLQLTVTGSADWYRTTKPAVTVQLDAAAPVPVALGANGTFSTLLTLDQAKRYAITVHAVATVLGGSTNVSGNASVDVDVTIPSNPPPARPAPTVTIDEPVGTALIRTDTGKAAFTVAGTVSPNGGNGALHIDVHAGSGTGGSPAPAAGRWSQVVELDGYGDHEVTVTCVNGDNVAAPPVTTTLRLVAKVPALPVDRRLFLVETIALAAVAGDCGAGSVLGSCSLVPGERATMHIETYRKDEKSAKSAQSILDSTASESAADFEQTLSEEQNRRAQATESTSLTLGVEAGAHFGTIANASLRANYTTQANSSREQAVKDLRNAVEKHATKASANRTVNVNTEFTSTSSQGTTEDSKRELANINASRVLSYLMRRIMQERLVVTTITDAKLGYYEQDVLLDAEGKATSIEERYTEYTLPEFADLAAAVLSGGEPAARVAQAKLEEMLSSIVNADGKLISLVDIVTPTKDGQPQPEKRYMRVNPKLSDTWQPRGKTGPTAKVPGIALSRQQIVMRTDGVLVDAILGEGEALDAYSRDLQSVTIAERKVAVERERLAQQIVLSGNDAQAALFAKLFVPEPSPETAP